VREVGVVLISDSEKRLALMLKQADHGPMGETLSLEVMPTIVRSGSDCRGVASLMDAPECLPRTDPHAESSRQGNLTLAVAALPAVRREQIVLPAGVLERIERHTLWVCRASRRFAKMPDAISNEASCCTARPGPERRLTAILPVRAGCLGRTVLLLTVARLA